MDWNAERPPDLSEPPNAEWPVQLFYGRESERKFRDFVYFGPRLFKDAKPDTLYLWESAVVGFRDGDLICLMPLSETGICIFAPEEKKGAKK